MNTFTVLHVVFLAHVWLQSRHISHIYLKGCYQLTFAIWIIGHFIRLFRLMGQEN